MATADYNHAVHAESSRVFPERGLGISAPREPTPRKPFIRFSSLTSLGSQDSTAYHPSPSFRNHDVPSPAIQDEELQHLRWARRGSEPDNLFQASVSRADAWWLAEILALCLSVTCLVAIAVVIGIHSGQPLSSWTFYLSLNTAVSVLGTIARTSVLLAISAALGQAKWIWFRKRSSQLSDFELMDNASRGPLGSLKLLLRLRSFHLITIGAVTTVLSLAMEPMLQALITTQGELDDVGLTFGDVAIGTTNRYDGGSELVVSMVAVRLVLNRFKPSVSIHDIHGADPGPEQNSGPDGNIYAPTNTLPDFTIKAALYEGLQDSMFGKLSGVNVACSTGNCTWPIFVSLGVCSTCHDVSDSMYPHSGQTSSFMTNADTNDTGPVTSGLTTNYSLDINGQFLSNYNGFIGLPSVIRSQVLHMNAAITSEPSRTIIYQDVETLLAAFTILRANDDYLSNRSRWEDASPVATECGLLLCLKALNSSVHNSTLIEKTLLTSSKKVPASYSYVGEDTNKIKNASALGTLAWNPLYHKDYVNRSDFQLSTTDMNDSWLLPGATYNFSQVFIDSTIQMLGSLLTSGDSVYGSDYQSDVLKPLYLSQNLSQTFESIATSLTNAMRNTGEKPRVGNGKFWVIKYRIRWWFVSLPFTVVLGGIVFTALSIIDTRNERIPAWKTNTLAAIAYSADDLTRKRLRHASRTERLDKAGRIKVYMREDGDGVELCHMDPEVKTQENSPQFSNTSTLVSPRPALPAFDFQTTQNEARGALSPGLLGDYVRLREEQS